MKRISDSTQSVFTPKAQTAPRGSQRSKPINPPSGSFLAEVAWREELRLAAHSDTPKDFAF